MDVIEKIKKVLEEEKWTYKYDGRKKMFTYGVDTGNVIGKIDCIIKVNKDDYVVLNIMNPKAPQKNINDVSNLLHKINFNLKNGNFELDLEDGEIRYKVYVNYKNSDISDDVIKDSIFIPLFAIITNGNNIIKLILD